MIAYKHIHSKEKSKGIYIYISMYVNTWRTRKGLLPSRRKYGISYTIGFDGR